MRRQKRKEDGRKGRHKVVSACVIFWWFLLTGDSFNKHDVLSFVDSFYTDIVTALQTSSDSTVPKQKSDF